MYGMIHLNLPIMTNKFYIVPVMTSFDAIYANRISVCRVASSTSRKNDRMIVITD